MRTAIRLFAILSCMIASAAHAVTVVSPPIRNSQGNNLNCTAQNLSDVAVTVSAEVDNGLGMIVDSGEFAVPPGQALRIAGDQTVVFGASCRFTFDADPAAVRGTISRQDAGGSDTRLIAQARLLPEDPGPPIETFLATVPLRSSEGNNFGCAIQNLSGAAVQVISEIQNGLGAVVDTSTITVPAGETRQGAFTQSAIFGGYCTFRFEAPPDLVRGFAHMQPQGGGDTRLIVEATGISAPPPPATPTPTSSPEPSATATPPDVPPCCGDCDGSGEVTINELITAVNNALDGCPTD